MDKIFGILFVVLNLSIGGIFLLKNFPIVNTNADIIFYIMIITGFLLYYFVVKIISLECKLNLLKLYERSLQINDEHNFKQSSSRLLRKAKAETRFHKEGN
jgi:hypothetical protein